MDKIKTLIVLWEFLERNKLPRDDFFKVFGTLYKSRIRNTRQKMGLTLSDQIDWEKLEKNPILSQLLA